MPPSKYKREAPRRRLPPLPENDEDYAQTYAFASLPSHLMPPLPTAFDIRCRIPPKGISPRTLSRSYGNALVGRGMFKNAERREKFWALVARNAIIDKGTGLLKPLYPGAHVGPPLQPPPPSIEDIRARIPLSDGIPPQHLSASYGDMIVGLGLWRDDERHRQFWHSVYQEAVLDEKANLLRLLPPFPTREDFRAKIPTQGIHVSALIGRFKGAWQEELAVIWTEERKLRFGELLEKEAELNMVTGIVTRRVEEKEMERSDRIPGKD